jgi:hypothetical protein
MQVSNSTGQGSDYRIGTNAGGLNTVRPTGDSLDGSKTSTGGTMTEELIVGTLEPGSTEVCPTSGSVWVEFTRNGTLIACASFPSDPGQVTLVEKDGKYVVEATGDAATA